MLMAEAETLSSVIGHQQAKSVLSASFESGRMPHAWLLTGQAGIGKSYLAHCFAAAVIAQNSAQDALFDSASSVSFTPQMDNADYRQVMQKAHPDFLMIAPIEDDKNKSGAIKTEQIRALIPFFSHKSARDGWRIAVIDSLDEVNHNGANAMLKILEEPPEKTILFLIATSAGSVLPTIRSRCRHLSCQDLSADEQIQILQSHLPEAEPDQLANLALLSGGSVGFALQLAETEAFDLYQASCHILMTPQADAGALLDISAKWSATSAAKKALLFVAKQTFASLLADAALIASGQGGTKERIAFEAALINQLAAHNDAARLADMHSQFLKELKRLESSYLDGQAVFMSLFHKMHSLAHQK